MYALLKPFVDLALLRRGPEDLPASQPLMVICALLYWLLALVVVAPFYPLGVALVQAGLDLALLAVFTLVLLRSRSLGERFNQTFTGLLGVGVVLGVLMIPVVLQLRSVDGPEEVSLFTTIIYLVLLGWLLTAYGHVLRRALDIKNPAGGVGLAILYMLLAGFLGEWVHSAWVA